MELIEDKFEREVKECNDCKTYLFCMKHCREYDRIQKMNSGMKCKQLKQKGQVIKIKCG